MRTKRHLFAFALGGAAGYIVGRHPDATYEKVRDGAGLTVGLAKDRFDHLTQALPLGRSGDHRAPTAQPPGPGNDVDDRTSPAYATRAHP